MKILIFLVLLILSSYCHVEVGCCEGDHCNVGVKTRPLYQEALKETVAEGDSMNVTTRAICSCEYSVFQHFDHPFISAGNVGCIGGCGGQVISYERKFAQPIVRLKVWEGCGSLGLKGILVAYDDATFMFGQPCGAGAEITFATGEHIVGDLTLSGNGIGTRIGYIQFKTNFGQVFEIGDGSKQHYIFPANGAFLTGVHGRYGSDLDQLGFIGTLPITSTNLENVKYPHLGSIETGLKPVELIKTTYKNDSPNDYEEMRETEVTIGKRECWATTFGILFGLELGVTAGVPEVIQIEGRSRWEISYQSNHEKCVENIRRETVTQRFNIPGKHLCHVAITQWASPLSGLMYEGDFVFRMKSGATFANPITGYYNGMFVKSSVLDIKCDPIE